MDKSLVTTTFTLEGYRVSKQMGLVRGLTVRSRSFVGTFGAGIQTMFGGNITLFTELCEQARQEAFDNMVKHADEIGANAILGARYDANDVMDGVTEVICYGTAVVVEKTT